jgi:hypothetical protein
MLRLPVRLLFVWLIFLIDGCSGDIVHLPDCGDCRPVKMSMDQVLELTVGTDRGLSTDASLHDPTILEHQGVDAPPIRRGAVQDLQLQ